MYGYGDATDVTAEVFSTYQLRDHLYEIVDHVEGALTGLEYAVRDLMAWKRPFRSALTLHAWISCCGNGARAAPWLCVFQGRKRGLQCHFNL